MLTMVSGPAWAAAGAAGDIRIAAAISTAVATTLNLEYIEVLLLIALGCAVNMGVASPRVGEMVVDVVPPSRPPLPRRPGTVSRREEQGSLPGDTRRFDRSGRADPGPGLAELGSPALV